MRTEIKALAGYAVLLLAVACTAGAPAVGTPTDSASQPPATGTPTDSPSQSPGGGGGVPAAYSAFFGSLETVPGVSGDISFDLSATGQIEEMRLDGGLVNFDCGGGKTIVDSGTTTYFFPDPITIEGGHFSVSRGDPLPLDWDGIFDSSTSVHGNIRLSGGPDCANRPFAVTWSATAR